MAGYHPSILKPAAEICSPVPLTFSEDWRYQRSLRLTLGSKGIPSLGLGSGRSCCIGFMYWAETSEGSPPRRARRARTEAVLAAVRKRRVGWMVMTPPVSRIGPLYRKRPGQATPLRYQFR